MANTTQIGSKIESDVHIYKQFSRQSQYAGKDGFLKLLPLFRSLFLSIDYLFLLCL